MVAVSRLRAVSDLSTPADILARRRPFPVPGAAITDPADHAGDRVATPDEPLTIRPGLVIPSADLDEHFAASGGPGGQHANRSKTRVELRLDLLACDALSEHQRSLLVERFGPTVRVVVDDERSQLRNRALARERLAARLRNALVPQRTRRPTSATAASRRRRLESKRRRSDVKAQRRRPTGED